MNESRFDGWKSTIGIAAMVGLSASVHAQNDDYPTEDWKTSTPESQGVDADVLDTLHQEFSSGQHGYVDGMLVIRNGHVVYERSYSHDYEALFEGKDPTRGPYNYYDPEWHPFYKEGALHTMQSVTKSVTSALIGIAIRQGEIPGVEVEVARYFDGLEADPKKQAMTLRDLLTMRAGIEWDESSVPYTDPRNNCAAMEQSEDWIAYVLAQPMAAEPGTRFVYNSGVTVMLAHILWKATGHHADVYATEHLFGPLGIDAVYWKKTPTGLVDTEGGLYLTPRDLAKIGYLYAKDGVWDGERILPEGWVASTMDPAVATDGPYKYGYQWWLIPYDESHAWAGLGYGGQRLLVVPEYDLIAVFTGWNIYDKPALSATLALERLLQSVR